MGRKDAEYEDNQMNYAEDMGDDDSGQGKWRKIACELVIDACQIALCISPGFGQYYVTCICLLLVLIYVKLRVIQKVVQIA